MRNQQNGDNNKYMIPAAPMMPPCMYPPGTVYNPIGVPPWAGVQPSLPPTGTPGVQPVPSQPPTGTMPQQPGPPVMDKEYIQGYLKTVIGRPIKAEFILGTNMFLDREGILVDVGIDHIVMRESRTDDLLICDLYSIKFVTVFY
ncbi:hypothetical protein SAMN05660462_00495 [Proteiniborus ethanoligenes]|uniref:Uncharacterized protein n=1 Tax=Proteiniborus ethanoligenes TaxID=415015 RepID=A0A1H3LEY3_9FIRM|nr:hypothetical protein [Proteiniborus ethanoligenes]TAH64027.1 MAG: hypothetical protein EWM50_00560 [Gottschalkiaceae bacterium]SDY62504.1 hypothetical protein SAMN05660462_00495 [Proteiniborus ethanoligenes]